MEEVIRHLTKEGVIWLLQHLGENPKNSSKKEHLLEILKRKMEEQAKLINESKESHQAFDRKPIQQLPSRFVEEDVLGTKILISNVKVFLVFKETISAS